MLHNISSKKTEVVKIAARSMQKLTSHPSQQKFFSQDENFRKAVMDGLLGLVKNHSDVEIMSSAIEGLIRVVESNYVYMGEYIPVLQNLTEVLMAKPSSDDDNKKIAQYSIEIWVTLCEVKV